MKDSYQDLFRALFFLLLTSGFSLSIPSLQAQYDSGGGGEPVVGNFSTTLTPISPPRFGKIGIDGRPLSDASSKQPEETDALLAQTYIDAFSLQLQHDVVDFSVPLGGGTDLSLEVRRSLVSDVSDFRGGILPEDRYDRPFGPTWQTPLAANIELVFNATEDSYFQEADYAYVTDENGVTHRFVIFLFGFEQYFFPMPSTGREQESFTSTLVRQGDDFVFTKKHGTQLYFETASLVQFAPFDRNNNNNPATVHRFARCTKVVDRFGTELAYHYGAANHLIPTEITFSGPGVNSQQRLEITHDGKRISRIRTPEGRLYRYRYSAETIQVPTASVPWEYTLHLLDRVTYPDSTFLRYDYTTYLNPDASPPYTWSYNDDRETYHTCLTRIITPTGRVYRFEYQHDQSSMIWDAENYEYYLSNSRPMKIWKTFCPGKSPAVFTPAAHYFQITPYDYYLGDPVFEFEAYCHTHVRDAAGGIHHYRYEEPELVVLNRYTPYLDDDTFQGQARAPRGVAFKRLVVTHDGGVQEVFRFNLQAGLAPELIRDASGNITRYQYEDEWNVDLNYPWLADDFKAVVLYNRYPEPTFIRDALDNRARNTYGPFRILDQQIDPLNRRVRYDVDALGRRTAARWIDAEGNLLQRILYRYEDSQFPNFVTHETIVDVEAVENPDWVQPIVKRFFADNYGRKVREILDPGGLHLVTRYDYDLHNNLISQFDPRGYRTRFVYDERDRLIRTIHPDGLTEIRDYDEEGRLILERDRNGHTTRHEYDQAGRRILSRRILPEGQNIVTRTEYNDLGSPTAQIDAEGNRTTIEYDLLQRPIATVDALGNRTTFEYGANAGAGLISSPFFQPTRTTDPRGVISQTTFDALYRPTSQTVYYDPDDNTNFSRTLTSYDAVGNVILETDPLGHQTEHLYDTLDRRIETIHPDGTMHDWLYSSTGFLWAEIDELGRTTHTEYDAAGRLIRMTQPEVNGESPVMEYGYDANGNRLYEIDPLHRVVSTEYDEMNRPVRQWFPTVFDEETRTDRQPLLLTTYDGVGNILSSTDARGNSTTNEYDAANRLVRTTLPAVTAPDGQQIQPVSTTRYDRNGNILETTDPNGVTTINRYDALNRLISTTNGEGHLVQFRYDSVGNRIRVIDGNGNLTRFTYDGLNRLERTIDASNAVERLEYDALNKVRRVDALGRVTLYRYDLRNRLTETLYPDRREDDRFFTYDAAGNLLTVREPRKPGRPADVTYTYDELNRLTSEISQGVRHQYHYDLAGNMIRTIIGETNRHLIHSFDALNRKIRTKENERITRWFYDFNGNTLRTARSDGTVVRTTYDALNRATSITGTSSQGQIYRYAHTYDLAGNLLATEETYANAQLNRSVAMQYDDAYRLLQETRQKPGEPPTVVEFTYDAADNRLTKTEDGQTTNYLYNNLNQLTQLTRPDGVVVNYQYDAAGNRILRDDDGAITDYQYDYENRLLTVDDEGEFHRYAYDYRTRRVEREEPDTGLTRISFAGGLSALEFGADGLLDTEYVRGPDQGGGVGGLLYAFLEGVPRYAHYNHRGDVTAETSEAGVIEYQATYEAFGERDATAGESRLRQKANTKEEDPTGLLNEGFRYRDLETGTFITRDPLGFVDGPNVYTYVRQNPWTFFDPLGLLLASQNEPPAEPCLVCHGNYGTGHTGDVSEFRGLEALPNSGPRAREGYALVKSGSITLATLASPVDETVVAVKIIEKIPGVKQLAQAALRKGSEFLESAFTQYKNSRFASETGAVGDLTPNTPPSNAPGTGGGVFHVTPEGVVMPPGKDFNLVPTANGKKGDFIQIHQNHDHGNLNAASGVGAHTHRPEVNKSSSGASSIKRVDSATTADDINQVDAALRDGTMRERTGRKDQGDL